MRTKQKLIPRNIYSCSVQLEQIETNQHVVKNPWFVDDLEEFLYFCCPECDERNQSKEIFIQHALDQHPNYKECLSNTLVDKEKNEKIILNNEDYTDFNEIPSDLSYMKTDYDTSDTVKCEIIDELDNEISKNNCNTIEDELNVVSNLKNADQLNVDNGIHEKISNTLVDAEKKGKIILNNEDHTSEDFNDIPSDCEISEM